MAWSSWILKCLIERQIIRASRLSAHPWIMDKFFCAGSQFTVIAFISTKLWVKRSYN